MNINFSSNVSVVDFMVDVREGLKMTTAEIRFLDREHAIGNPKGCSDKFCIRCEDRFVYPDRFMIPMWRHEV